MWKAGNQETERIRCDGSFPDFPISRLPHSTFGLNLRSVIGLRRERDGPALRSIPGKQKHWKIHPMKLTRLLVPFSIILTLACAPIRAADASATAAGYWEG